MGRIIVVGAGFSGSILARMIADECRRKVEVVEKRSHVGGNMYDEYDEHGILVQHYGPHFLNTNKYWIIEYLSQYAELFPHNTKLLSFLDGQYIRLPFNFQSVQELIGAKRAETVLRKLREHFPGSDRVPILQLVDCPDRDVSEFGTLLFEKAFRTYTSKMWGTDVNKIDKYVLERVPFAMNYDERYLNKDFQYLPKKGFTEIFRNMLDHPNIDVRLETDALEHIAMDEKTNKISYDGDEVELLIFTGPIDELFHYKFGSLPYRSLDIRYESNESEDVLPAEIISFPQAEGKTRSTEYRKIMFDDSGAHGSVVTTEYPLWYDPNAKVGNIPYYPVVTQESEALYGRYLEEAAKYKNLFLCGRLAEFKYYNMDVCIEHAFEKFNDIRQRLEDSK